MRKFKFFIDCDKEEKWLNEMAKRGYELENVFFGYKFRSVKPENSTIRIDYRTFKKKGEFIDYCILFEDSGWKHIAGSKYSEAQYFKRIDMNNEEDIFSDVISKAGKYKRLFDIRMALASTYVLLSVSVISTKFAGHINDLSMLNPKLLYYTPGLWERTGVAFWGGFLFETPFAVMRGFLWLMPLIAVIYICSLVKIRIIYNKQKKEHYM
jgi:hypothetical protein